MIQLYIYVLGDCGYWSEFVLYYIVHTHERPFIRVGFQPSGSCSYCPHWLFGLGREVAPRKVELVFINEEY